MDTKTDMTYKSLKKISKVKEQIRFNTSWVKESQLENKLYKLFKELADEMIGSVQYLINRKGAYENAGSAEVNLYLKVMAKCKFNYQQRSNLHDYINRLVDNLDY